MKRIIIADDDEQNLYMLDSLFKGHNYETVLVHNGEEALFEARENAPDLIISDILMPVLDGFSLCRAWRLDDFLKNIPFVFYTATYTDEKDEKFALSLGADKFIVKPTEPREFLHLIEEVLDHLSDANLSPASNDPMDEQVYLREYNETLIRKLENKMIQLKRNNKLLEKEIKARKKSEQIVKLHLENLQQILQTTSDCFLWVDKDGRILSANPAYCTMSGYTENELTQMNLSQLVAPGYKHVLPKRLRKIYAEGKARFEGEHICKNGTSINVDISNVLINWENDRVIASFLRDVTKQRNTERRLAEREELYRILVETIPCGVQENDLEGKITFSNRAHSQMHGYEEGEMPGKYIWDFKKSEKEKIELQAYLQFLVQEQIKPEPYITQDMRKDGSLFDAEVDWAYKHDSKGRLTGFISVITDITKRLQTENEMRKLMQAIEQSPVSVMITDLQGKIEYINSKYSEISGYSIEDLLGKTPKILKAGNLPDDKFSELWENISAGEVWQGEFHNVTKNGEYFWEQALISPIYDNDGQITHYFSVKEDITEKRNSKRSSANPKRWKQLAN